MKKTIILVSIIVSVMILGGAILFTISGKEEQKFNEKTYEVEGEIVKEINIDVRDRQIEVSVSKDDKIHITYSESDKEYYDINVSSDNILKMRSKVNKEWKDFVGNKPSIKDRKISLQIPNSLLKTLKLSTTNENIKLSSLEVTNDINIESNGGDISFDKIDAGKNIILTGKDGNIKGSIVGGYDDFSINCKIKKGDCNLPKEKKDGSKKLSVDMNNGNIEIDFNK